MCVRMRNDKVIWCWKCVWAKQHNVCMQNPKKKLDAASFNNIFYWNKLKYMQKYWNIGWTYTPHAIWWRIWCRESDKRTSNTIWRKKWKTFFIHAYRIYCKSMAANRPTGPPFQKEKMKEKRLVVCRCVFIFSFIPWKVNFYWIHCCWIFYVRFFFSSPFLSCSANETLWLDRKASYC